MRAERIHRRVRSIHRGSSGRRRRVAILQAGDADLISIARQALNDPHWLLHAARSLGCDDNDELWPPEYGWWLNKRKANLPGDPRA